MISYSLVLNFFFLNRYIDGKQKEQIYFLKLMKER